MYAFKKIGNFLYVSWGYLIGLPGNGSDLYAKQSLKNNNVFLCRLQQIIRIDP